MIISSNMKERSPEGKDPVGIIPIELSQQADGSTGLTVLGIGKTKEEVHEASAEFMKRIAEATGAELGETTTEELNDNNRGSVSKFLFSSSNWRSCNWKPKGPKQNWAPPSDPRLN